jgi:hypothetical protein
MSDEYRALIEEARVNHRQSPSGGEWCFFCRADWPCHAIRLADAMEAESARAARLAEYVDHQHVCQIMEWFRAVDRNSGESDGRYPLCTCGLTAALGLDAGERGGDRG